jgi:two-component system, NarL family, response regulator NreC
MRIVPDGASAPLLEAPEAAAAVRILVVDDHPILAASIAALLERHEGLRCVGITTVGGCASARRPVPDLIVLRADDSLERALRAVGSAWGRDPRRPPILALSGRPDAEEARAGFDAGARGYLPTTAAPADLLRAVEDVGSGGRYVHPGVGAALATTARPARLAERLSDREQTVLRLIALGLTNREIAERLRVSRRTVETHRSRVMAKLDARSRADAVRHALLAGLVGDDQLDAGTGGQPP